MKEIYSKNGEIKVYSDKNNYYFSNAHTGMYLNLYKKDVDKFMNISKEGRFSVNKSYSNFMTNYEKETIKSYLRIKNKRLTRIKSLINNGENLEDILNIASIESLIEYIGDNKWKSL